jgi:hypothetical protein
LIFVADANEGGSIFQGVFPLVHPLERIRRLVRGAIFQDEELVIFGSNSCQTSAGLLGFLDGVLVETAVSPIAPIWMQRTR